jgi:hypothetical protein
LPELIVVCGPLTDGAFLGLMVALALDSQFIYAERFVQPAEGGLFPVKYRVPAAHREPRNASQPSVESGGMSALRRWDSFG